MFVRPCPGTRSLQCPPKSNTFSLFFFILFGLIMGFDPFLFKEAFLFLLISKYLFRRYAMNAGRTGRRECFRESLRPQMGSHPWRAMKTPVNGHPNFPLFSSNSFLFLQSCQSIFDVWNPCQTSLESEWLTKTFQTCRTEDVLHLVVSSDPKSALHVRWSRTFQKRPRNRDGLHQSSHGSTREVFFRK